MSEPRVLPPWDDEWSDGCTASPNSGWWGSHLECCLRHDEAYYYGGTKEQRRDADLVFRHCLVGMGVPVPIAWMYWGAVRAMGPPRFRFPKASWAFGGELFQYTDKPGIARAEPARPGEEPRWATPILARKRAERAAGENGDQDG